MKYILKLSNTYIKRYHFNYENVDLIVLHTRFYFQEICYLNYIHTWTKAKPKHSVHYYFPWWNNTWCCGKIVKGLWPDNGSRRYAPCFSLNYTMKWIRSTSRAYTFIITDLFTNVIWNLSKCHCDDSQICNTGITIYCWFKAL